MTDPPAASGTSGAATDQQAHALERNARINAVLAFASPTPECVPVLVKDCIDVAGMTTTHGSAIHRDDPAAAADAFVVSRLRRAGAGIAGKTHLTEFCFGATGENAHFGNARNPWDTERITGGSSSGSAAAIAGGIARLAIGTDTGGSVRVPAALCGIVGLRPSRGRVSNRGALPVSTICDTIGPMAATVRECAWLFDVIAAFDRHDPLSRHGGEAALPGIDGGVTGMRIAVARPYFFEDASAPVIKACNRALGLLEANGAGLRDVSLGDPDERRAHHAIRFVAADVADARREVYETHPHRLGSEVRRRIAAGRAVSGIDYAASIRALHRLQLSARLIFERGADVIATPTTPITAPLWADSADMVETTRRVAGFTYDIGATGLPSLSVPCGFDSHGLPIGLQLIAPWGCESRLFRAAHSLEVAIGDQPRSPVAML